MSVHDVVVENAIAALKNVHGDTSVSLEQTLESLEMLEEELGMLVCAVEEDIRRRKRSEMDSDRDMWP